MFSRISTLPTLLLACDLGKSGGKFFYKLSNGPTQALWMDSEVAHCSGVRHRSSPYRWAISGQCLVSTGR